MADHQIISLYKDLKKAFAKDTLSDDVTSHLLKVYKGCNDFLNGFGILDLSSKVPNKNYFSFVDSSSGTAKKSRPVNLELFKNAEQYLDSFWSSVRKNDYSTMSEAELTSACYRIAVSFCSSIDLIKKGDQKTPGTYFECLIGHLFSKVFNVRPTQQLDVLNIEMSEKLPTDFIFDRGEGKPKYHVPIKTSTRERVIQVWAHQRVLDGVYGTGRFLGLLTCLSETKRDDTNNEVFEICLPAQWKIYQLFIAQMKRIYYLDPPVKYLALNEFFPKIQVKPIGAFFKEFDQLEN